VLPWLLNGCTSLDGSASSPAAGVISAPAVAVLINRTWVEQDPRGFVWEVAKDEQSVEEQFTACVTQAASSMDVPIRVITGTQFRAVAFPDLDPRAAPRSLDVLRSLIPDPRFRERVEAAGIRYIAIVGGQTHTSETQGGIVCVGGYGGGACFGHLWWDHASRLSALVVDMQSGAESLTQGIDVAGRSGFAVLGIFPLAAPSSHEAEGCERFGRAIAGTLGEMNRRGD
jgi:hypothetical protein